MDIKKIKYNQELIKNKIRLSNELTMINQELSKEEENCNHIRVIVDCEGYFEYQNLSNSIMYCLICNTNLTGIRESMPIIDATFFKGGNYSKKLEEVRNILIKIKENNPEISDKILIEETQKQIDTESKFLIEPDGYTKRMILCRNLNNEKL